LSSRCLTSLFGTVAHALTAREAVNGKDFLFFSLSANNFLCVEFCLGYMDRIMQSSPIYRLNISKLEPFEIQMDMHETCLAE
jgi:hypothetical protein